MRVDNSRNCGNAPPQLLRYAQVRRAVRPTVLTSIGAGSPKLRIWVTMSAA
jgi:hypothetical protein